MEMLFCIINACYINIFLKPNKFLNMNSWDALFFFIFRQLANIKEVQTAINSHDFVGKVLPHIARRSDAIVREVLAFLSLMLFNANRDVQVSHVHFRTKNSL